MKFDQSKILFGILILLIVVVYVAVSNIPGPYDDFAKCVSANGTKMYGASWCSHCKTQKEMFQSSWKYITYIECAEGTGQTDLCFKAGISSYPTWEFKNGDKIPSVFTLQELSEKTGCVLPK